MGGHFIPIQGRRWPTRCFVGATFVRAAVRAGFNDSGPTSSTTFCFGLPNGKSCEVLTDGLPRAGPAKHKLGRPFILLNAFLTEPLHYFIYLICSLCYRAALGREQSAR